MQTNTFQYKWWALIGLSLLSFTAFLDYTIVSTALPFIQKDLNASVLQLQWVVNIFVIILSMFMIIMGKAGDLWGRTKVFYVGFVLFGIAALGAGFSPTIQWLIFFRAIQGLAAGIIFTLGVALLPQAFPLNEQTRAIGIFSAFNGAGLAVGPFLGGLLITYFSWRWVFWINIPIILVGIAFCSFSLKPSHQVDTQVSIDWTGFILLILTLGCLVYGLIHGEQVGWENPYNLGIILIGLIALFILIPVELKSAHPLLDLSIFSNAYALLAIIICVIAGLITAVFMFFDPLYLKLIRGQVAFTVGMTLLSVPIVQVLISLLFEKLIITVGIYKLILWGLISAFLSALAHFFFTPLISIYFVILALMLMGYAWGIANAGSIAAVHQSAAPEKLGGFIGTIFTFWNLSSAISLAMASVIFHWQEKQFVNDFIQQTHLAFSPEELVKINDVLNNPEQSIHLSSTFPAAKVGQLAHLFQASFMSGYHAVAVFAMIVMLIALSMGLYLKKYFHADD